MPIAKWTLQAKQGAYTVENSRQWTLSLPTTGQYLSCVIRQDQPWDSFMRRGLVSFHVTRLANHLSDNPFSVRREGSHSTVIHSERSLDSFDDEALEWAEKHALTPSELMTIAIYNELER